MIDIKKLQEYVNENPQIRVYFPTESFFREKKKQGCSSIAEHEILSIEDDLGIPFDDSDEEITCEINTKLSTGEVLNGRFGLISKSDFLSWTRDKKIDEINENMG